MNESREKAPRSVRQSLRLAVLCGALLLLAASSAGAQTVKLERGWQFLADKDGTLKASDLVGARAWRDARVGVSWNAQFADLRDYMGVAGYRTAFDRPDLDGGRRPTPRRRRRRYLAEVLGSGHRARTQPGG